MKIQHTFGEISIEKEIGEDLGLMLTNNNNSYIFLRQEPTSRYEGIFLFDELHMYKFIEDIHIVNSAKIKKIRNKFFCIERERDNITESFFMPRGFSSVIYELDKEADVGLFLDCKDSYDNNEFGRYYDIFTENNCIVVKFTKRTDERENTTSGIEQYTLYLAVKPDSLKYKKAEKWIKRHYTFDEKRNSKPYYRYVFQALNIKAKKIVFSMSKDKKNAIKEAIYIFENSNNIKEQEKDRFNKDFLNKKAITEMIKCKKLDNEKKIAYAAALNSINSLAAESENFGIIAGLPWFFQFWSRDEAVSLKALGNINNTLAKKILLKRMDSIQNDGRLPNLLYADNNQTNADAIGWLFNRAFGFYNKAKENLVAIDGLKKSIFQIKKISKIKKIQCVIKNLENKISQKEKENKEMQKIISISIDKCINGIIKNYAKEGLIYNNSKETWMDTDFKNNGRKGFNIEIQALALALYKYAYEITNNKKYKILENVMKNKVLEKFFENDVLIDNLNDRVIRPNVFIACYLYPDLLPGEEWEKCFEKALQALWLDFGGLSSIDKKNPLFTSIHTGEEIKSYHNGDSWFWLNDLAALMLYKTNKDKFKKEIEKIIEASTSEILWKGIIGSHSELSSAEKLRAEGCLSQAWSNAMFVELIDAISK